MIKTVLASSSPRRLEILKLIGVNPEVIIPEVDEGIEREESVEDFVRRISKKKSDSIYSEKYYGSLVISADTVVVIDNTVVGKPKDRNDAFNILEKLSDNIHSVLTGIFVRYGESEIYSLTKTLVEFNKLSVSEINFYIENEDYMDKAGAYAIQGLASVFVKKIDGCFFNVMGFPVNSFYHILKNMEIPLDKIRNK